MNKSNKTELIKGNQTISVFNLEVEFYLKHGWKKKTDNQLNNQPQQAGGVK